MDFLFDCCKKRDLVDAQKKLTKKNCCPFGRNRETLLYNNPNNNNQSIELSHSQETLNINVPQLEPNKNYDTCSSAVYAENFENEQNKKV